MAQPIVGGPIPSMQDVLFPAAAVHFLCVNQPAGMIDGAGGRRMILERLLYTLVVGE